MAGDTHQTLNNDAKDIATGTSIAQKYMAGGAAIANSTRAVTSTGAGPSDAAGAAVAAYLVGEGAVYVSTGSTLIYQVPDLQATEPVATCIMCDTASGSSALSVLMPINGMVGQPVTVADAGANAQNNHILVEASPGDQIEDPLSLGSYIPNGLSVSIATKGMSVTWRYIPVGASKRWKVVAKVV